ncbi:hypothetical protein CDU01_01115 [Cronobacter sakazakii]|nr:hypothetical protein [Cronobacter sakazakii]EGT5748610.1 hypothetical protein [Cronobacter sakazakii]KAB0864712.1 hypothetical protein FZI03_21750 [Cronobacter sakazakii]NCI03828.1 hypothetical protein [Cronobacter sakazakii]NCI13339.1 hypothetical protein [Cronobacter sakazakii]
MKITNTEFNVLRVMAEKEIDWMWIMLDRALAIRGIEGFDKHRHRPWDNHCLIEDYVKKYNIL